MEKMKSARTRSPSLLRRVTAVAAGLLCVLGLGRTASAQGARITVTGRVTSPEGAPLPGVSVTATGTDSRDARRIMCSSSARGAPPTTRMTAATPSTLPPTWIEPP